MKNMQKIDVTKLKEFQNHPYKVKHDDEMEMLIESIKDHGILSPIIVRPLENDEYEIISGHRRLFASKRAGLAEVPALVIEMDRDNAAIALVDSNLHRDNISPSEKAFAYGDIPGDESEDISNSNFERKAEETYAETNYRNQDDFSGTVSTALHGAAALADMIDSGSDDEEERKKEQEAKMTGGNLGAAIGIAAGIVSALVSKDEPDEELIREQEEIDEMLEDEIEDEEYIDFMMGM